MNRPGSPPLPRRLSAPAAQGLAQVPGQAAVRSLLLENGLKIIVWSDHSIPSVALHNWVRVGSRNEVPGLTGLAHFFEHMMFNGTARHGAGEFDRLMEGQGGSNNAFTCDDVTVYQDWFPRGALDLVFELEADRIQGLSLDPALIESERGVVYSERLLRVDDNNQGYLSEQVQAHAFIAHPYRFPTIGLPDDIRGWKAHDLRQFYRTYYAPNNQTIVLVGDVSHEEAFALARRYFGRLPRQPDPPAVLVREPEQVGERRVMVRRPAQMALLQYAYKAPAADDPLGPALNLLLTALVDGNASRLHRLLVEQRMVAQDVAADWHQGFDPSLCWFWFTLAAGVDPHQARAIIDAELAGIATSGLAGVDLERARNLNAAGFWKQLSTIDGKAHLLGEYESLRGGWRHLFDAPERHATVTPAQIAAAAQALLNPRRRTVGMLLPQDSGAERDSGAAQC
ncbi:MAG TPA: pitrilysin family protein [Steroidobacteraceae bacterium]|jgi:zinc protease|nr:pitrilysin family protein [Steroidobacteraceae bacterium]